MKPSGITWRLCVLPLSEARSAACAAIRPSVSRRLVHRALPVLFNVCGEAIMDVYSGRDSSTLFMSNSICQLKVFYHESSLIDLSICHVLATLTISQVR